jgi:uncharacterized membrane protein
MDETGARTANDEASDAADARIAEDLNGPHEVFEGDQGDDAAQSLHTEPSGDPDVDTQPELIIANFASEAAAKASYDEIREAERQGILLLLDVALVSRDNKNNLHIKEEQDMRGEEGALVGVAVGAILGAIAGPLGLIIGGAAGAAVGAAAAEGSDGGMLDDRLREFAQSLKPGSSMVIVAVDHYWSELTSAFLTRAGSEASTILLTDDIARQLDVHRDE